MSLKLVFSYPNILCISRFVQSINHSVCNQQLIVISRCSYNAHRHNTQGAHSLYFSIESRSHTVLQDIMKIMETVSSTMVDVPNLEGTEIVSAKPKVVADREFDYLRRKEVEKHQINLLTRNAQVLCWSPYHRARLQTFLCLRIEGSISDTCCTC